MSNKPFQNVFKFEHKTFVKWIINITLTGIVAFIVYMSGGATFSYTHLMYIPIIFTAFTLGLWQTIIVAVFAGLVLGPLMPQDVASGQMQNLYTWVFRLTMFIAIGSLSAVLRIRLRLLQSLERNRFFTNVLTNYPNLNKLKFDLERLVETKTPFSLLSFRILNMNGIRQNVSYEMGTKIIVKILEMLSEECKHPVYSTYNNELGLVVTNLTHAEAHELGVKFLKTTANFMYMDSYRIGLLINGGIVHYPEHAVDATDAIQKIAMVLDQTTNDSLLHEFNDEMASKSRTQAEFVPGLLHALKKDEFTLVYQPKINLNDESDLQVEALLRWHHPLKGMISPGIFIPIAEEAGLITEITKTVISKVIAQTKIWQSLGLTIKTSINISYRDLINNEFIDYLKTIIFESDIDPALMELEITERSVIKQSDQLIKLLNELRTMGIKISIDDFGTGHNSLINLLKIPMDYVKIDKSFIDHITKNKYKIMIAKLIELAHQMDIKVIAEGVEKEKQFNLLKTMRCDFVQGYYLSRPLEPDTVVQFYKTVQKK